MAKVAFTILAVLVAGALLSLASLVFFRLESSRQRQALQSRTDFPQIVAACVTLARATTNDSGIIWPTDPAVPQLLRSLSPKYLGASSNYVTMEFHGGFDHHGYRVRQSGTNPALWSISWYTEQGERLLTTITSR